jgi:hypothetical protein
MIEEVIYVDDKRIKKHFIREVEGIEEIHFHKDPRMLGVYCLPIQVRMWEGEYVELDVPENTIMLGIITELAAHHPRARLYLDGVNQTLQYLDTFVMGDVDGIGCIKWYMVPKGCKTVRLQVTESRNPLMQKSQRARNSGFCFGGFILKSSFTMPTPVYTTIYWNKNHLDLDEIPPADENVPGTLDVGDIPHPCKLQFLKLCCDCGDVEVLITDGWGHEYTTYMNVKYTFRFNKMFSDLINQKVTDYATILKWDEKGKCILLTLPLSFMEGMHIRLINRNKDKAIKLLDIECAVKVRLC